MVTVHTQPSNSLRAIRSLYEGMNFPWLAGLIAEKKLQKTDPVAEYRDLKNRYANNPIFGIDKPSALAKALLWSVGVSVDEEVRKKLPPICQNDYATTNGLQSWITTKNPDGTENVNDNQWVTVNENPSSPFKLVWKEDRFYYDLDGQFFEVQIFPSEEILHKDEATGKFKYLGHIHMQRARFSPIAGCRTICYMCSLPALGEYGLRKGADEYVTEIKKAYEAGTVNHVLISGGTPKDADVDAWIDLVCEISQKSPTPVQLMCEPRKDPSFLRALRLKGKFSRISLNLEVLPTEDTSPDQLQIMRDAFPTKLKGDTDNHRLENLRLAREIWPKETLITSILIVGLVSNEEVLRAAEKLIDIGVVPILSQFAPDEKTPLKDVPKPSATELADLYVKFRELCERKGFDPDLGWLDDQHNIMVF